MRSKNIIGAPIILSPDIGDKLESDITIVGAGVHGVGVYAELRKQFGDKVNIIVIDKAVPLQNMYGIAKRIGMTELRSPAAHHLGEIDDVEALIKYSHNTGGDKEYHCYDGDTPPSIELFQDHSMHVAQQSGLFSDYIPGAVTGFTAVSGGGFDVSATSTSGKIIIHTKNLVMATGLGTPKVPEIPGLRDYVRRKPGTVFHADSIDCNKVDFRDKEVLVIGGAQTSATVANTISDAGGNVTLTSRSNFVVSQTEVDPIFFSEEFIKDFQRLSTEKKEKLFADVRGRGSLTPTMYKRLLTSKYVDMLTNFNVEFNQGKLLHQGGFDKEFDYVVLGTGYEFSRDTIPYRGAFYSTQGKLYPDVDRNNQSENIENLFFSGRAASFSGGPTALNIKAARGSGRSIAQLIDAKKPSNGSF